MTYSNPPHAQPRLARFTPRPCRKTRPTAARDRRGASLVELAVIAPVIFLLVFGIIEFGRLMMVQEAMTNAARAACRDASLATTLNASDVDTMARNVMLGVMSDAADPTKVRVSLNPASLSGITSGTPVTVDIQVNFSDVGWLPTHLLGFAGSRVLIAQATFDRE